MKSGDGRMVAIDKAQDKDQVKTGNTGNEVSLNMAVTMQGIGKKYGAKSVMDDLTVSFPEGKIIGLLGPNGAGKSTLLKMLTGLTKPDRGEIKIFGQTPNWALNAAISYLPDRGRWYGYHTVRNTGAVAKL